MTASTSNKIQSVEDLKYYLKVAIQLEHATIPPYLVALYSIKPDTNVEATNIIRTVVVEEMLHLTLAVNLLNAIGGAPDLNCSGFVPQYPVHLPDGERDFLVDRAALSMETIETFLNIERPAKENCGSTRDTSDDRKTTIINTNASEPAGGVSADPHMCYYSIGEFYDEIIRGFKHLDSTNSGELFFGDPERQITSDYYYSSGGAVVTVSDLDSALQAIDGIIEQGEGARNAIANEEGEIAHYYRFEQLKLGRYYRPGDQPGAPSGEPLEVDWSGVYQIKKNVIQSDYPADSELHAASLEFNATYSKFLQDLTKAFNGNPSLLIPAVQDMFHLKALINALVRNPIPGSESLHGAPTFEVNTGGPIEDHADTTTSESNASLAADSLENQSFIDLSVALTGFSEFQLHGTGMVDSYYSEINDIVGKETIDQILSIFQNVAAGSKGDQEQMERQVRLQLMGDPKLGPVTRNILKLWYSGYWYQLPEEWRGKYGERERDITFVVSPASYTEGLLWPAAGANPAGAKPIGFGAWEEPPRQ